MGCPAAPLPPPCLGQDETSALTCRTRDTVTRGRRPRSGDTERPSELPSRRGRDRAAGGGPLRPGDTGMRDLVLSRRRHRAPVRGASRPETSSSKTSAMGPPWEAGAGPAPTLERSPGPPELGAALLMVEMPGNQCPIQWRVPTPGTGTSEQGLCPQAAPGGTEPHRLRAKQRPLGTGSADQGHRLWGSVVQLGGFMQLEV